MMISSLVCVKSSHWSGTKYKAELKIRNQLKIRNKKSRHWSTDHWSGTKYKAELVSLGLEVWTRVWSSEHNLTLLELELQCTLFHCIAFWPQCKNSVYGASWYCHFVSTNHWNCAFLDNAVHPIALHIAPHYISIHYTPYYIAMYCTPIHFNTLFFTMQCGDVARVVAARTGWGAKQTEILSVNGKPSEYRSLNIHYAPSVYLSIVCFKSTF